MRFTGEHGETDRVWLDASDLSPEYSGVRCLLEIGIEGGVVCTHMEGTTAMTEGAIRRIATEAVVAVEMSVHEEGKALPLRDARGRTVELDTDDDEAAPIDDDVVAESEQSLLDAQRRLPWPWGALLAPLLLTACAVAAVTTIDMPPTMYAVLVFTVIVGVIATCFSLWAFRGKILHDREARITAPTARREMERRRALDRLIKDAAQS